MIKPVLIAALASALLVGDALADTIAPTSAALSPLASARRRPPGARAAHCERKADSVGVRGKAREIYMRKCSKA